MLAPRDNPMESGKFLMCTQSPQPDKAGFQEVRIPLAPRQSTFAVVLLFEGACSNSTWLEALYLAAPYPRAHWAFARTCYPGSWPIGIDMLDFCCRLLLDRLAFFVPMATRHSP